MKEKDPKTNKKAKTDNENQSGILDLYLDNTKNQDPAEQETRERKVIRINKNEEKETIYVNKNIF